MPKRVSTRKIKKNRVYTYDEAAEVLGLRPGTIRSWRSKGLQVMTAQKPHFILGEELKSYCEARQGKKAGKMDLDKMRCCRCQVRQKPLWAMVDYVPVNDVRGQLEGLCEVCEGPIKKFAGRGQLDALGAVFDITMKDIS